MTDRGPEDRPEPGSEEKQKLKADKLAYFRDVVETVRFNPPEDVAAMRRRNNAIRARTAASVALKARMPMTVKGRK